MRSDPASIAARVLASALARPATLGQGRLICIDGLAGSGKTTLAAAVRAQAGCRVLHLDDFYPGWRGLDRVADQVGPLLHELASGRPGTYRRWDWDQDAFVEEVTVDPSPLLVIEGVGAGHRSWSDLITLLVWLDSTQATRLERGLDRDGAAVRDQWIQWQDDEQAMLAKEGTDRRADLVVDTND